MGILLIEDDPMSFALADVGADELSDGQLWQFARTLPLPLPAATG